MKPLIDSCCTTNSGCHGTGSYEGPGVLTNYAAVCTVKTAIISLVISGAMPENTQLPNKQKNAIVCWIDEGATQT